MVGSPIDVFVNIIYTPFGKESKLTVKLADGKVFPSTHLHGNGTEQPPPILFLKNKMSSSQIHRKKEKRNENNGKKAYFKQKYIKSKQICTNTINVETLNADNAIIANLQNQNGTIENLQSQNATITNLETTNLKTLDLDAISITTGNITVNENLYLFENFITIEVGPNKEFTQIQQVLDLLVDRIIFATITILVDPGTYNGFNVSGFQTLNNNPINIIGDQRSVAGTTYVNRLEDGYYTFNLTTVGGNTQIVLIDNSDNSTVNLQQLGLAVGDKVVFYNNDISLEKKDRFTQANVISVDSSSFTIDQNVTVTISSTVTFLPNVFVKQNRQDIVIPPPGVNLNDVPPTLIGIGINLPVNLEGFTVLEPDTFTNQPSIVDHVSNGIVNIIGCVVTSLTWDEKAIGPDVYTGFRSPGGFQSRNISELYITDFTILGTGYNPRFEPFGPFTTDNTVMDLEYVYIIGSVENKLAYGILYISNCSAKFKGVGVIGSEEAIGIFVSKSDVYDSQTVLLANLSEPLYLRSRALADFTQTIIDGFDVGITAWLLSDGIFTELSFLNMSPGGKEFCIKDASNVVRDDFVVVSPCP